jgi:RNA polymerase primary sigma factor
MREMTGANKDSVLASYFAYIAESHPLTRDQERALAGRIQQGDTGARDELVRANLRFVVSIAMNYLNRGLSLADLISAGNMGLLTAAERFDAGRGFKFISYAVWWIRQSIIQSLIDQSRTVRLPANRIALIRNIHKTSRRLSRNLEAEPALEDIAEELELPVQELLSTVLSARVVCSLDDGDDDSQSLLDSLPDRSQRAPDDDIVRSSDRLELGRILATYLDRREQRIVQLYFGLDGNKALTLEQIGTTLGLTRERVRQIKEDALAKLRRTQQASGLQPLVENC